MDVRVMPSRMGGTTNAPASKSELHRILILASLGGGARIGRLDMSADISATVRSLRALGATVTFGDGFTDVGMLVPNGGCVCECSDSASTLRFLLPVAGSLGINAEFRGSDRLGKRGLGDIIEPMSANGCTFSADTLPLRVSGRLRAGAYSCRADRTSQALSGLLISLVMTGAESSVTLVGDPVSSSYTALTVGMMKKFGAEVIRDGNVFYIGKNVRYTAPEYIEPGGDWSNAAPFLVAGALADGVTVKGLDPVSLQGDRAIVDILRLFGASCEVSDEGVRVEPGTLRCADIDASDTPDLVPLTAVLAAAADGVSHIAGTGRLINKESDRNRSTVALINSLGGDASFSDGVITVRGGALKGGTVDSFGDHRIVMAACAANGACSGDIIIKDAHSVSKSFPDFFERFGEAGGKAYVIHDGK